MTLSVEDVSFPFLSRRHGVCGVYVAVVYAVSERFLLVGN